MGGQRKTLCDGLAQYPVESFRSIVKRCSRGGRGCQRFEVSPMAP
jgi:hypothetical protein